MRQIYINSAILRDSESTAQHPVATKWGKQIQSQFDYSVDLCSFLRGGKGLSEASRGGARLGISHTCPCSGARRILGVQMLCLISSEDK